MKLFWLRKRVAGRRAKKVRLQARRSLEATGGPAIGTPAASRRAAAQGARSQKVFNFGRVLQEKTVYVSKTNEK